MKTIQLHSTKDQLPKPQFLNEECATYYLVYLKDYGFCKAMYLTYKGKAAWYSNYTSKIIRDVLYWGSLKIDLKN
jgi:hypothetical protein